MRSALPVAGFAVIEAATMAEAVEINQSFLNHCLPV
jgi:hypothetical protein